MRVPDDSIISITSDYDPITLQRCTKFECSFFVSNRNEIPLVGEVIEADLRSQYVNAYVTEVSFNWDARVELSAIVAESFPIPDNPTFFFDPASLKQQLIDIFKYPW